MENQIIKTGYIAIGAFAVATTSLKKAAAVAAHATKNDHRNGIFNNIPFARLADIRRLEREQA